MERMVTWDERKRQATLLKRGLDFADIPQTFFEDAVILDSHGRYKAIGWLNERPITVIFEPLGTQGLAVVSMRISSVKERKLLNG